MPPLFARGPPSPSAPLALLDANQTGHTRLASRARPQGKLDAAKGVHVDKEGDPGGLPFPAGDAGKAGAELAGEKTRWDPGEGVIDWLGLRPAIQGPGAASPGPDTQSEAPRGTASCSSHGVPAGVETLSTAEGCEPGMGEGGQEDLHSPQDWSIDFPERACVPSSKSRTQRLATREGEAQPSELVEVLAESASSAGSRTSHRRMRSEELPRSVSMLDDELEGVSPKPGEGAEGQQQLRVSLKAAHLSSDRLLLMQGHTSSTSAPWPPGTGLHPPPAGCLDHISSILSDSWESTILFAEKMFNELSAVAVYTEFISCCREISAAMAGRSLSSI